ncbi:hypothetical protein DENSPDRAFT_885308 [Dentipellis sp. KUC8613]|nr:hypothetical protein DENSPDRAFT_885308 [Dentipellis sp. KUC8613]
MSRNALAALAGSMQRAGLARRRTGVQLRMKARNQPGHLPGTVLAGTQLRLCFVAARKDAEGGRCRGRRAWRFRLFAAFAAPPDALARRAAVSDARGCARNLPAATLDDDDDSTTVSHPPTH